MKVIIIGAGNLATNLALAFYENNVNVVQIMSKNISSAKKLAKKINCQYTDDLQNIKKADIYFISISDDAIKKVANSIFLKNKFLVHTAGAVNIDILSENTDKYGVFYPLQTFKKEQKVCFSEIPVCIEAVNENLLTNLQFIAEKITKKVYKIDSQKRLKLHIAGVFTNNFINHLMFLANKLIEDDEFSKEILIPLLEKTFSNLKNKNFYEIQTGPAKRKDIKTINKHLEFIEKNNRKIAEVYRILTESIKYYY